MVRWLISVAIHLAANALALWIADLVLDDMSIEWSAFLLAVAIFTIVEVLAEPLLTRMALRSMPALRGSVALVVTFLGLLVTVLVTDGLDIDGGWTWVAATVIVWLGGLDRRPDPAGHLPEEGGRRRHPAVATAGARPTRPDAGRRRCCGRILTGYRRRHARSPGRQARRRHRRHDGRLDRLRRRPAGPGRGGRDRAHGGGAGPQPHPAHGPQAGRPGRRARARRHRARAPRRRARRAGLPLGSRRRRAALDRVRPRRRASATTSWPPRGTTSPWPCTSRRTR